MVKFRWMPKAWHKVLFNIVIKDYDSFYFQVGYDFKGLIPHSFPPTIVKFQQEHCHTSHWNCRIWLLLIYLHFRIK